MKPFRRAALQAVVLPSLAVLALACAPTEPMALPKLRFDDFAPMDYIRDVAKSHGIALEGGGRGCSRHEGRSPGEGSLIVFCDFDLALSSQAETLPLASAISTAFAEKLVRDFHASGWLSAEPREDRGVVSFHRSACSPALRAPEGHLQKHCGSIHFHMIHQGDTEELSRYRGLLSLEEQTLVLAADEEPR